MIGIVVLAIFFLLALMFIMLRVLEVATVLLPIVVPALCMSCSRGMSIADWYL